MRESYRTALLFAAIALGACASYDGRNLVAGQSRAADVGRSMGAPAERLELTDGESLWFYPRGPEGLDTYAVRLAPDGTMRSIRQVLTEENTRRLVPHETTKAEVDLILGPPWRKTREGLPPRDIWRYRMYDVTKTECNFYVWFSDDGRVEKTLLIKDFSVEPGDRAR